MICTDAGCEAAGSEVVPAYVRRDQILGFVSALTSQQHFDCILLILLPKN